MKKTLEMENNFTKIKLSNGQHVNCYVKDNLKKWTLLFVHGINSSSDFGKDIYELENNFNIVSINFPGSKYSNDLNSLEIDYFNSVASQTLSKISSKKIALVGHSLGGATISKLGANKNIKKLFFISTLNPYMIKSPSWDLAKEVLSSDSIGGKIRKSIVKVGISLYSKFSELDVSVKDFLDISGKNYKIVNNYILNKEYMENTLHQQYMSVKNKESYFYIGSEDKIITPKLFIKYIKENLDQEVSIVENCGHSPLHEKYEYMHKEINDKIPNKNSLIRKILKKPLIKII